MHDVCVTGDWITVKCNWKSICRLVCGTGGHICQSAPSATLVVTGASES